MLDIFIDTALKTVHTGAAFGPLCRENERNMPTSESSGMEKRTNGGCIVNVHNRSPHRKVELIIFPTKSEEIRGRMVDRGGDSRADCECWRERFVGVLLQGGEG